MIDLLAAVGLNASFWTGIWRLVAGRSGRNGVERVLMTAIAGFVLLVVTLEVLGAAGSINRVWVATTCLLAGAAGLVRRSRLPRDAPVEATARRRAWSSRRPSSDTRLSLAVCGLALWAALLHLLVGLVFPVQPVSDAPIYHLYFAVRWWQSGSLELVPTPFGEEAATYFPANGDLWLTWLLATGAGPFVKVGQWPFVVVGATALVGIARDTGAPWPAAILPAALWTCLPIVLTQSNVANVDLVWTAFYFGAVHFLVQWLRGRDAGASGPLVFFGLACGIVIGTKTLGAALVVPLLLPALAVLVRRRHALRHAAPLLVALLVPSAFWYLRNIWLTGNPVYPLQLSLFGRVWAEGWYGRAAMDATAYHVPVGAWWVLLDRLLLAAGPVGLTLAVAGVASGWLQGLRSSRDRVSRITLAMYASLAAAHGLIYWYVAPYNTQERFLSAALGLALVPLSSVAARQGLVQSALCLLLVWHLVAPWHGGSSSLLRLSDNPLAFGQGWLTLALPASILVAAIVLERVSRARWLLAGTAVVLGCAVSAWPAAAWFVERPVLRFYPRGGFADRLFPGWEILERAAGPGGSRVAYAGTNLPYYLLGIGLRNEVEYVNINRESDWRPHDYHRARSRAGAFELARDPWPQWYRADADIDAWMGNLRRRGIAFLFVARENRHGRLESARSGLPRFPIEKVWADAHPDRFVDLGPSRYDPGTIPWVRVYRVVPAP